MTINGACERNICFTIYRYVIAMASLNRTCGLCRASLLNGDWAFRISGLLDVVVEFEDKIQHYMCPKCKRWLVSLENAAEDLTKKLSEDESKLGRALAGGHLQSIAKAVMGYQVLR